MPAFSSPFSGGRVGERRTSISVLSVSSCSTAGPRILLRSLSGAYGRSRTGTDAIFIYFPILKRKHFGTKTNFFQTARFNNNHLQPQKWDTCPEILNLKPVEPPRTPLHTSKKFPTCLQATSTREIRPSPTKSDRRTRKFFPYFSLQPSAFMSSRRVQASPSGFRRVAAIPPKILAPPAFEDFPKDFRCEGGQ